MQNNIHKIEEVDSIYKRLNAQNIHCIEITLRTKISWDAIALFKQKYGGSFGAGVGTITSVSAIQRCIDLKVDFMVSPGLFRGLIEPFEKSGIPFLSGVATPSEIIFAMELGWRYLKFFPADLFGGVKALKTYGSLFQDVTFCPTGGINLENHNDFLALPNVISVGGSWLTK